jgi:hypothetical protein
MDNINKFIKEAFEGKDYRVIIYKYLKKKFIKKLKT